MRSKPLHWKVNSLNHWTARDISAFFLLLTKYTSIWSIGFYLYILIFDSAQFYIWLCWAPRHPFTVGILARPWLATLPRFPTPRDSPQPPRFPHRKAFSGCSERGYSSLWCLGFSLWWLLFVSKHRALGILARLSSLEACSIPAHLQAFELTVFLAFKSQLCYYSIPVFLSFVKLISKLYGIWALINNK